MFDLNIHFYNQYAHIANMHIMTFEHISFFHALAINSRQAGHLTSSQVSLFTNTSLINILFLMSL